MRYRAGIRAVALGVGLVAAAAALGSAQDTAAPVTPAPAQAQAQSQAATPGVTRFTLVQVAGKRLPAETEQKWRCREEVTAGVLSLRDDGRWLLETDTREVCGERTEMDRDTEEGTYTREGGSFRFLDDEGQESSAGWGLDREVDLDELKTGTLVPDGTLTIQLAEEKHTLVFRRQAS